MTKKKEETPEDAAKDNRQCFFITPIGEDGSTTRRKTDGLLKQVLKPVLRDMKFDIDCSHTVDKPGSITNTIIGLLLNCDLVIANLTELNPNVMYELAVRHAVRKPVVCIAEKGTRLPFDISDERTVFYNDDIHGAHELKEELKRKISACLEETKHDNPIYRHKEQESIIKNVESINKDTATIILEKISKLEEKIYTNEKLASFSRSRDTNKDIFITVRIPFENDDEKETIQKNIDNFVSLFDDMISELNYEISYEDKKMIRLFVKTSEYNRMMINLRRFFPGCVVRRHL
ncbi:nucleoside 2-deoxyribosyltransferase [Bacteroidales bacterium OttesenSCG-928-J19]|nr:nucleoside 2-deoxyribosyltransferase [Bacteroidales bacterium OttesenSCG-928-J19]